MFFVERFIILCPYLGESIIRVITVSGSSMGCMYKPAGLDMIGWDNLKSKWQPFCFFIAHGLLIIAQSYIAVTCIHS